VGLPNKYAHDVKGPGTKSSRSVLQGTQPPVSMTQSVGKFFVIEAKGLAASDQSVFTLAKEFDDGYVDHQAPRNIDCGGLLALGIFEGT